MPAEIGWFPVMKTVENLLKESESPALQGVAIYQGTKGTAKSFPCVEIIWDNEAGISMHNGGGDTGVWIDTMVNRAEGKDDSEAYAKLYEIQQAILAALDGFPRRLLTNYGIAAKADVKQIMSDGAEFTTTFGSRAFLTVSRK